MQADRHVCFHAAYGKHYQLRVPTFGRSLAYLEQTCELLIGSAGPDLYRLDLMEGRFKAPLVCSGVEGRFLQPTHTNGYDLQGSPPP